MPIESLNLLMLNVGYAEHNADWNWKYVSSPFTRIYYVSEGEAHIRLKATAENCHSSAKTNASIALTSGHLYIIPAHTMHDYECDGKFCHYYLHVYEGFKSESNVFDTYDFPIEVDATDEDIHIFQHLCELYPETCLPASDPRLYDNNNKFTDYVRRFNEMELYQRMHIRGSLLVLFSRFMRHATPRIWTKDERMARVLNYIHANIYNDIDIDTLASIACVTKPYLIRIFKHNFGTSPLQYINQKKIERAQLFLITREITVKELAYTMGFNDHSYFIRLFKKITGVTPMEYRTEN